MRRFLFTTAALLLFLFLPARSQEEAAPVAMDSDSVRVSLVTCSPGTVIYELFGHTAIRYEDRAQGIDIVFNYGVFSFETPHFVWRFVKGETDYCLWAQDYPSFENEYLQRGSPVLLQELNLTPGEKRLLFELLRINFLPQNRTYRYNYFYDNCTTRARDIIEKCTGEGIRYNHLSDSLTFRQIIHRFTAGYPWSEFGIDLLIGAEADRKATARQAMFIPLFLSHDFDGATLADSAGTRPLVKGQHTVPPVGKLNSEDIFISPFAAAVAVFVITLLLVWAEWKSGRRFWLWDILLYGVQGLAGCVIFFLTFFSTHPTVDSNWLLWVLNPLPLLYLPYMLFLLIKRRRDYYHAVSAALILLFFLASPLLPQAFNVAVYPYLAALILRSIFHFFYYKR